MKEIDMIKNNENDDKTNLDTYKIVGKLLLFN